MAAKQPSGRMITANDRKFVRAGLCALKALAELVAPIEGVGVQHLRPARDGSLDGAPHGRDADDRKSTVRLIFDSFKRIF
jgi:hypothetical protein